MRKLKILILFILFLTFTVRTSAPQESFKGVTKSNNKSYKTSLMSDEDYCPFLLKILPIYMELLYSYSKLTFERVPEIVNLCPSPDTYFCLGNLYLLAPSQPEYSKAIEAYERVISLDPNYIEAYINKAVSGCTMTVRETDKELGTFRAIQRVFSEKEKVLPEEIEAILKRALNSLDIALKLNPSSQNLFCIYFNRGIILNELYKEKEAAEAFTKAIQMGGLKYSQLSFSNLSIESEREYSYLVGDIPMCLASKLNLYFLERMSCIIGKKKFLLLSDNLGYLMGENDPLAFAFLNRGIAYARLRVYDKAIENFNQAIKLNSDIFEFYAYRGLAHMEKRNIVRATADLLESAIKAWRIASLLDKRFKK